MLVPVDMARVVPGKPPLEDEDLPVIPLLHALYSITTFLLMESHENTWGTIGIVTTSCVLGSASWQLDAGSS